MKDETLLPCPFCGSPAEHYPDGDMEGYSIMCSHQNGPCNMWAFGYETPEEAERAWNTRATLQSGNSGLSEHVSQTYKLPPNSFTDDELMGMAHGDNPVANAYRELLEFRRNAAGGNSGRPVTVPVAYFYPGDESECKSVSLPEELDDEQKANCIPLVPIHKASDGWIPVSERMPEPGRWLALYGAPVYTHGQDAGKPWHEFIVDQGYLDKEDGKFYFLNWEYPGQIGDSSSNLLAIATHWMYWELPYAPKVTP